MVRGALIALAMTWPALAAAAAAAPAGGQGVLSGFEEGRLTCRAIRSVDPECIVGRHQLHLQRPDGAALDTGMFFAAWYVAAGQSFRTRLAPPGYQQRVMAQDLAVEKGYWDLYRQARTQAGLSDADVYAAAPAISATTPDLLKTAIAQWGD